MVCQYIIHISFTYTNEEEGIWAKRQKRHRFYRLANHFFSLRKMLRQISTVFRRISYCSGAAVMRCASAGSASGCETAAGMQSA